MSKKSQELELRNIMQGLEEFATFMSYQSNYEGLRILSVETVSEHEQRIHQQAKVVHFPRKFPGDSRHATQSLHRAISIRNEMIH